MSTSNKDASTHAITSGSTNGSNHIVESTTTVPNNADDNANQENNLKPLSLNEPGVGTVQGAAPVIGAARRFNHGLHRSSEEVQAKLDAMQGKYTSSPLKPYAAPKCVSSQHQLPPKGLKRACEEREAKAAPKCASSQHQLPPKGEKGL